MNSTIQASFLYYHSPKTIAEDTHFRTITRLKSTCSNDILENLFFNMSNQKIDISKESLTSYFNENISAHFSNENTEDNNIEEHIIKHNNNALIFTFNTIENSIGIRYLTYTETPINIYTPGNTTNNTLRNGGELINPIAKDKKGSKKDKKPLFSNIFGIFKKKKTEKVEEVEA